MSQPNQVSPTPSTHSAAITSNATTTIVSGPCIFDGVVVTNAGTTWTWQAFDSTTGSGFALTDNNTATVDAALYSPGDGILCANGITVVTAGTTPGSLYVLYSTYIP